MENINLVSHIRQTCNEGKKIREMCGGTINPFFVTPQIRGSR